MPLQARRDLVAASSTSSAISPIAQPAKLYNGLLRQDPRGRIGIMAPWLTEEHLSALALHFHQMHPELAFIPERMELHCIPMWTVMYLQSCEIMILDRQSGAFKRAVRTRLDYGCSVSAVPDDHWASNLVLRDDMRDLTGRLAEQAMQREYISPDADDASWRQWMNDLDILETHAVPFAKGYPKLNRSEMSAIAKMAEDGATRRGNVKRHDPTEKLSVLTHEFDTIAVPTYRPVCRAIYPSGTAYWDGLFPPFFPAPQKEIHGWHFTLSNASPKFAELTMASDFGLPYRRWMPADVAPERRGADRLQKSQPFIGAAEQDAQTFANYIMRATNRAKLDWEDPNILSAAPQARGGVYSIVQHAEDRIANEGIPSVLPQAFRPQDRRQDDVSASSLFKRPTGARPAKARPDPPGAQRFSPLRPGSATLGQRPRPLLPQRGPAPRPRPAALRSPQVAQPVLNTTMYDVDSAYRHLGLSSEVDGSYLDPQSEDRVNRVIAGARRLLQLAYHPDLVEDRLLETQDQKAAQAQKTENMSAAINAAYDRVRNLDARLAYQRKTQQDS